MAEVKLFENSGLSPAVTMAQRMHLELLDAGMTEPAMPLPYWNDPAMVAFEGEIPIGCIVYRHNQEVNSWFILCAYVHPEHRRKGIHTLLFNTLVERARKRGDVNCIQSGTHPRNYAAQAAFERQGRVIAAIHYDFKLKDFDTPKEPLVVEPAK